MTALTQLEILDLRHFSAARLRALLEQEAKEWQARLTWDYGSSTELLLQYLDSRILPGFVALDRGRVCGFAFCVYEGHKAVIGDAYSVATATETALEVTSRLLSHLLELLTHSPDVDRMEAQLLLYDADEVRAPFLRAGFTIHARLFMECGLHPMPGPRALPDGEGEGGAGREILSPAAPFPSFIECAAWSPALYQAAAELIHASYAGHVDATINDQYRSLEGSLRFLHNVVRFPGCGVFEPNASWTLRDRRSGELVGLLLCSRIAPRVAHITQLCITPKYRSHGLGQKLLRHCATYLHHTGFRAITLTVSEANGQAVRRYVELGFTTRHRFDAMVLDKRD